MGRIAALAAGITAAIAAGWAVLTRRRSAGDAGSKKRGKGRGKGKRAGGGGTGKRAGGGAGGRAGGPATSRPATDISPVQPATDTAAATPSSARQEQSTAESEAVAAGTAEEAGRYSQEAGSDEEAAAAPGGELQGVKGIGAVSQERLAELGVTTLEQVAAWSDDDIERIAEQIRISAERIRREDWVGQARAALES